MMDRIELDMITTSDELVEFALSEYESLLIRYATTIVHDHDRARDIVQDTFIRLYKQDVEKMKDGLKSWLYTVCRNRALDVLRREKRMVNVEDSVFATKAATLDSPDLEASQQEQVEKVMKYMDQLSENQRICIQLKFQQGLSYTEISEKTGLKSGNIGFLIHAGLKRLRELLPSRDEL
jgi:RNA polymerase sigma factor (sigma-70 family)